jgi:hypothetical protein
MLLGSDVGDAIAGMTCFKNIKLYELLVWSGGRNVLSISATNAGIDAITCRTEVKKQVLPKFWRVRVKSG